MIVLVKLRFYTIYIHTYIHIYEHNQPKNGIYSFTNQTDAG